jgi:hypothetical protein
MVILLDDDPETPKLLLQLGVTVQELAVLLYGDNSTASSEAAMVLLTNNSEMIATELRALLFKLLKQRKEATYGLTRILQLRR